jgi:hypothetical protein
MLKRTPKAELDRHEAAIESAFVRSAHEFKAFIEWSHTHLGRHSIQTPRVLELLKFCEAGDDPKSAAHRHFLANRYPGKS